VNCNRKQCQVGDDRKTGINGVYRWTQERQGNVEFENGIHEVVGSIPSGSTKFFNRLAYLCIGHVDPPEAYRKQ
jgi:hypothetical protein